VVTLKLKEMNDTIRLLFWLYRSKLNAKEVYLSRTIKIYKPQWLISECCRQLQPNHLEKCQRTREGFILN
jgi:hypothetical protein